MNTVQFRAPVTIEIMDPSQTKDIGKKVENQKGEIPSQTVRELGLAFKKKEAELGNFAYKKIIPMKNYLIVKYESLKKWIDNLTPKQKKIGLIVINCLLIPLIVFPLLRLFGFLVVDILFEIKNDSLNHLKGCIKKKVLQVINFESPEAEPSKDLYVEKLKGDLPDSDSVSNEEERLFSPSE